MSPEPIGNFPILTSNWTTEGAPDGGSACGAGFAIFWQRGALDKEGRNGAFILEILAVCKSQLEYYQSAQFPCEENETALLALTMAIEALQSRLNRREASGVLGTHLPDSVAK